MTTPARGHPPSPRRRNSVARGRRGCYYTLPAASSTPGPASHLLAAERARHQPADGHPAGLAPAQGVSAHRSWCPAGHLLRPGAPPASAAAPPPRCAARASGAPVPVLGPRGACQPARVSASIAAAIVMRAQHKAA
eukprot:scaffold2910_cov390-Prasinococcus_capsulatus_cf.AAC.51